MSRLTLVLALAIPLLSIGFASALLDLLRDAPGKLFAGIVAILALGVAWHLGLPAAMALWLNREDHALIATAMATAGLAGTWLTVRLLARRRFQRLRWPATLDAEAFRQYCQRYLAAAGWAVEVQSSNAAFRAGKSGRQLQVHCLCGPIPPAILKAIGQPDGALAVAHLPLSADLRYEARRLGVRLVHYTQLAVLDDVLAASPTEATPAAWQLLRAGDAAAAAAD